MPVNAAATTIRSLENKQAKHITHDKKPFSFIYEATSPKNEAS
jgi:hypothetical protein